jgi:hypothetical protein
MWIGAVSLVITGGIATGKSSVAEPLGRELGWPVFSSDGNRKRQLCLPLAKRPPPQLRPEVYSDQASEQTYRTKRDSPIAPPSPVACNFGRNSRRKFPTRAWKILKN